MTAADELALDLLGEGITGMKIWPFDYVVHAPGNWDNWRNFGGAFDPTLRALGGQEITNADLNRALEPFRKIRAAVGDQMEIMVEGHGFWSLPAAKKIGRALEEFRPYWLEDLMRADDVPALAELAHSVTTPVLASEYLTTRYEYKPVLEARAADIIMIDPTWAGGITESKKIATMAETYKRPVAMHDCTGPFTLYAGIHLAINATNAVYQESLRSYLRVTYPELVTEVVKVVDGHIPAPTAARPGDDPASRGAGAPRCDDSGVNPVTRLCRCGRSRSLHAPSRGRVQKESHRKFRHPLLPGSFRLAGQAGHDAKPYQERDLRSALLALRVAQEDQKD
jgi:L-alanine-DL-glutamate epimerase-like enolase superfamily enzyme